VPGYQPTRPVPETFSQPLLKLCGGLVGIGGLIGKAAAGSDDPITDGGLTIGDYITTSGI
jgi:hypothetical protein